MDHICQPNANRFTGFADIYDNSRPVMPTHVISLITGYLGCRPQNVVDLGSGTGLSTAVWEGYCEKVVGIEPNEDMIKIASCKSSSSISFQKGFADKTGLPDAFADVVICSQSFHWMEPYSTLIEVDRILRNGGVFASIDCDWPPVSDWRVDQAFSELYNKIHRLELVLPDIASQSVRFNKENHLKNLYISDHFRYIREIVFSQSEPCNTNRMIGLMLSQGSLQEVLRKAPVLIERDVSDYQALVDEILGNKEFSIEFSYRMRIAVK
ncbi:MAG: class I SAM-dependent methyltransferase [Clostridiaceae bacterium]|nr:class I SAM-dependent methyltransferase [Clostridiaceae bacterium]